MGGGVPPTYAFPVPSTSIDQAISSPLPPRYVAYSKVEPSAENFATKVSRLAGASRSPAGLVLYAPCVTGYVADHVVPAIYAAPVASLAMHLITSSTELPAYVA